MVNIPDEHDRTVTVITKDLHVHSTTSGRACLIKVYGDPVGKQFFLENREVIIGRSEAVQIQVDQDSVSRQHCKLTLSSEETRLQDLGSTNGTYLNDIRVGDAELRDGDFIRVGQTIFKYLSGSNVEAKYYEEIYRLTTVDALTRTYNKRFFSEAIEKEFNRALRYQRRLSLVMFDIDHFKTINDTHGHLAGDYVLRELSSLVAENLRREDVFARYGGEEFTIILPEIEHEGAVLVCEKIRGLVEVHRFEFSAAVIPVTISLGIRSLTVADKGLQLTDFLAQADTTLYRAKQSGRNRVCS